MYIKASKDITDQNLQNPPHAAIYFHHSGDFFSSVLAVYLDVCFGVFNFFSHTKLIKAGPGPQRSCRLPWREITLL